MAKFFITLRSISDGQFSSGSASGDASLGAIRYLSVPDGEVPALSHAIGLKAWVQQVLQTFPTDPAGNMRGDLVFLVHGFNQGVADVDKLHTAVTDGLHDQFGCTIVSFDWPSWTETYAYLPQLDVAKKTAIDLVNAGVKPMLAAQTDRCQVAIHAVCHSMGAFVLREALDHADDGLKTGSDWTLNQLVLVSGDVEASDFVLGNKDTESMMGHCYRLTNYFNKLDEVLQISNVKRFGVEARVGRIGLPPNAPDKTVNIDCSQHFETVRKDTGNPIADAAWSHSWYFQDAIFFSDLAATLSGKLDRTVVPGRTLEPDGKTLALP